VVALNEDTNQIPSTNPYSQIEDRNLLDTALEEIQASLEDRKLLEMYMDGYESTEIAASFGWTPVNVRVRITRLKQRLAKTNAFLQQLAKAINIHQE
jgi:DNA-directed RNA polymerase specialized sigma24 family protein